MLDTIWQVSIMTTSTTNLENEMTKIKSVRSVEINKEWLARVRLQNNEEFFAGKNAGYNLAQAQALIRNNRVSAGIVFLNPIMNNSMLGIPDAPVFKRNDKP